MSSSPPEPTRNEDVELLKLVGAVLETTRTRRKKKKRQFPGPLELIYLAQVAVYKGARKNPLVSICAMVIIVTLAYLFGVTSTSYAQKTAEQAMKDINARSAAYRLMFAELGGPIGFTPSDTTPVDTDTGRRPDIARDLLSRIVKGDYTRRSEIATGRFLREFETQIFLLLDVDRTNIALARRGPNWLHLKGPYELADKRWKHRTHLDDYTVLRAAKEVMIRLLKEGGLWKVEHIRV